MRTLPAVFETDAPLVLDGENLNVEDVVAVARFRRRVTLSEKARRAIRRCRAMVEVLLEQNEKVYGLTTGFGKLRDVVIAPEDAARLQENLIMSHACGVGRPFSEEVVRAATVLRINTLCRGNSGIRLQVVQELVHLLNDDIYVYVPEKGSVGASGDLAPLSHLMLVLIGHPHGLYLPRADGSDSATPGKLRRGSEEDFRGMPEGSEALEQVAEEEGWTFRPVHLEAKEGLALNNGTQFMTAVAALAAYDACYGLRFAELAGALSLEAQRGVRNAYDERLHRVRNHEYQAEVARRVIAYCDGSQILDLYLNSAHLYRAGRHLGEADEFLGAISPELEAAGTSTPPTVRNARQEVRALGKELRAVIPTNAEGEPDGERIAAWSKRPPREQITRFDRLLRPLRERASDLLRQLDSETFPHTEASAQARSALVSAVKQLDDAVPGAPLVQDDYSFRCFPQVLACGWRALWHVVGILEVEINSANDNPLLFPPEDDPDLDGSAYADWLRQDPERIERCRRGVLGGGNFHGEPVAVAMDYLSIAMAEVASIAERRIAHLVDENLSRGLPSFLIDSSGLNSGFMIPQYTAAALVSENKVLCHPASVDSIPTCANAEDHVSMGTIAARKSAEIIDNVLDVIAIEILTACQGLKFRLPLSPGERLCEVLRILEAGGVHRYEDDRVPYPDFRRIRKLMEGGQLRGCLG